MELALIVLIWTISISVIILTLVTVVLLGSKSELNNARRDSIVAETDDRRRIL